MNAKNLKGITEHISYEIQMFELAADKLKKGGLDPLEVNVFLECFVIHARCLADFLYLDEETQPDDVLATHFVNKPKRFQDMRPEIHELLKVTKSRVGKEIVHLTYTRVGIPPESKAWDLIAIQAEINKALHIFFECLNEEQRHWFPVIV